MVYLWGWACLCKQTKVYFTRVCFTGCPFVSLFSPRVCVGVCVCVCGLCQMWVCTNMSIRCVKVCVCGRERLEVCSCASTCV